MRRALATAAMLLLVASAAQAKSSYLFGTWGGPHAAVAFQGGLADVQLDCASGTIDVPILPAKDGTFQARGTFRAGHPGPVHVGQIYRSQPASYAGKVVKQDMTLTITLEDGTAIGPFTLIEGAAPQITRCL
jgi:hypothetical protein